MKVAISIADNIFSEGENLAKRLKTSRSQLYSRALAEFVARHDNDTITSRMNQTLNEVHEEPDDFIKKSAYNTLKDVEW